MIEFDLACSWAGALAHENGSSVLASEPPRSEDSLLPPEDDHAPIDGPSQDELRRAMKAFKKRLKLSRLDAESGLGRGAMTGGNRSGIISIIPPHQYPKAVWDELVRRGRLKYIGQGLYEIVAPDARR